MVFPAGHVVTTEQMSQSRELLGPSEFFQHAAQVDHIVRARDRGQWRILRPQQSQPSEDMRIPVQLVERANLRILSAEIIQKVSNGSAIGSDGCIPQRSRHRFGRWPEKLRQRSEEHTSELQSLRHLV